MKLSSTVSATLVRAAILVGVVALGAGCLAPSPDQEPAPEPETTSQVSQAVTTSCDPVATFTPAQKLVAQRNATKAWSYLLGNNNVALAPGFVCDPFRNDVALIRSAIASGKVTLERGATVGVCGLSAQEWRLSTAAATFESAALASLSNGNNASVNLCFGAGTASWFGLGVTTAVLGSPGTVGSSVLTASFDPEPAVLTANLDSATGAAAAAVYTNSGEAFTAVKFGTLPSSCGTVVGGTPCSTTALTSGSPLTKVIVQYSNGTCSCR